MGQRRNGKFKRHVGEILAQQKAVALQVALFGCDHHLPRLRRYLDSDLAFFIYSEINVTLRTHAPQQNSLTRSPRRRVLARVIGKIGPGSAPS
jgi:hypothetical protein